MNGAILRRLVVKDLYLLRWPIGGSLLGAFVSLALMPLGPVFAYVGGVTLICTLVILNIVVVMQAVVQERKDKVLLFVLSLPVSTGQHTAAKALATLSAFAVPWLIVTVATAIVIDVSALPNGILPFLVAVLVYLLAYHAVLLAATLAGDGAAWSATVITIGNVSINLLIPLLLGWPSVAQYRNGPVAVWTPDILALIGVELMVGAAALALGLFVRARRSDFVMIRSGGKEPMSRTDRLHALDAVRAFA